MITINGFAFHVDSIANENTYIQNMEPVLTGEFGSIVKIAFTINTGLEVMEGIIALLILEKKCKHLTL